MADSDYSTLIRDGLYDPSPSNSISRVKTAVARELEALDSTAKVKSTEFFNHTFAPDFILRWPDNSERRVFLRMTYDTAALAEDVDLIDAENPLIFGLTPPEATAGMAAVADAVDAHDAMFTQPDAINALIDRKAVDTTATMLGNALAQGGRGTFDTSTVSSFADTVATGFEGASALNVDVTAAAVTTLKRSLGEVQSTRMTRVMQAVWEGSDGRIDQFPGSPDLSGRLNVEALRYLVTYVDTDDADFWKRVGRRVTIGDLAELDFALSGDNIERLITANLDVITARAAFYVENPLGIRESASSSHRHWGIHSSRLTFEADSWFAVVGESKKALEMIAPKPGHAVSVSTFVRRATNTHLIEAKIQSGAETLTIEHENGHLASDRLTAIADQYDGSSSVVSAVIQTPSGRLSIDTASSSATGITKSNIRLADLLSASAPLVLDVPQDDVEGALTTLAYESSSGEASLLDTDF